jgi:hypothetical protein
MTTEPLAQSETVLGPSVDGESTALVQAAEVARVYLEKTRQAGKNQAFEVLAELAARTVERASAGKSTEFTALALKQGVAPEAAKEPSGWMSPLWSRLVELEPQWQEGLADTARTLGLVYTPKLTKHPGSPAIYSLTAVQLPTDSSAPATVAVPAGGLHYTPESVAAPAAWLGSALRSGVLRWTVGVRWTLLASIMLPTIVVLGALALSFNIGIRVTRPLSLGDLLGTVAILMSGVWLIPIYRFLDQLFDLRIVMAPMLLTPMSQDNVTLEMRRSDPDNEVGELAFVRYTAICPVCDGNVVIDSGRREFPDRLVGRCRRSAREHVFSFDHVLRVGRPLR